MAPRQRRTPAVRVEQERTGGLTKQSPSVPSVGNTVMRRRVGGQPSATAPVVVVAPRRIQRPSVQRGWQYFPSREVEGKDGKVHLHYLFDDASTDGSLHVTVADQRAKEGRAWELFSWYTPTGTYTGDWGDLERGKNSVGNLPDWAESFAKSCLPAVQAAALNAFHGNTKIRAALASKFPQQALNSADFPPLGAKRP